MKRPLATKAQMREFARRDWGLPERLDARHWEHVARTEGLSALFRVMDRLREDVRALRPEWPDASERREDLLSHHRVTEVFARVAAARRRKPAR